MRARAPSRFEFSHDFAAPKGPSLEDQIAELNRTMVPIARHEELLKDAEHRAYERGYKDGRESEEAKAVNSIANESAKIAQTAQNVIMTMDGHRNKIAIDAAKLSYIIASKLAGYLIEQQPGALVEQFIAENLEPLNEKPTLHLSVSPSIIEKIEPQVQQLVEEAGYAGRLVLTANTVASKGDCALSWADGSIMRSTEELDREIQERIARYFGSDDGSQREPISGELETKAGT